jgi:thiol-disulfide isomerase/thioredoxin
MRPWLPIAFGGLLLVACSDPDPTIIEDAPPEAVCGNGTLELGEVCDGVLAAADSCAARGFAEGQLSCSAECVVDTAACIVQDEDADGLLYQDELAAGTDPTAFDTDGDGISDGVEVSTGADPLNAYSWPEGIWPDRLAAAQEAGLAPTGNGIGQVRPNFTVTDQFGAALTLHQLYGYVVVVSVGAVWCPPCQQAAEGSEEMFQEYVGDGVVFVEVMLDGINPGIDATQEEIDAWVSTYGITFPVARPTSQADFSDVSALPTFLIFDRDMRMVEFIEGFPGDSALSAEIAQAVQQAE